MAHRIFEIDLERYKIEAHIIKHKVDGPILELKIPSFEYSEGWVALIKDIVRDAGFDGPDEEVLVEKIVNLIDDENIRGYLTKVLKDSPRRYGA